MLTRKSFFTILFFIIFITQCNTNKQDGLHLTLDQLTEAGYYAYILPEEYQARLELVRDIYMYSFDVHCGEAGSAFYNPVVVTYENSENNYSFSIGIAPTYDTWNRARDTELIFLDSRWTPNKNAEYQILESGGTALKFKDIFGMEVVVYSNFEFDDLIEFIYKLEYVGPDLNTIDNPWQDVCE